MVGITHHDYDSLKCINAPQQGSEKVDSASDSDSDLCAAAESEDEIVDETVHPSSRKNRTRSKPRKVVISDPIMCSDSEDDLPRQQR